LCWLSRNRFRICVRLNVLVTDHDGSGNTLMTRRKKKRAKCKEEAAKYKKAGCNHPAHSLWMMALGRHYQARCLGCETAGPVIVEGPWAAQEALYRFAAR
jgi:hypothetical protein